MVDREKRFNILAVIGPIAAAAIIGVALHVLYPDMSLSSSGGYSDNSATSSGTASQYGGTPTGGNNTASQDSDAGSSSAPTGPGY